MSVHSITLSLAESLSLVAIAVSDLENDAALSFSLSAGVKIDQVSLTIIILQH